MDNLDNVAQTGANLEVNFSDFSEKKPNTQVNGYVVLDVFTYTRGESETDPGKEYPKAIAVMDEATGDIYVHFRGTGDGNWNYNSAAYGGPPSRMQEEALKWFDSFIEEQYEGNSRGNLYVTGHSQGGNNAQFVTIRSRYADYITNCVPLDAPGFSEKFETDSINLYGEAFYERQCDKIWAYNGECDYVSCLGQISIVPEGHTSYLKYTDPNHTGTMDFRNYHAADGLLDENGNITIVGDDSAFRKYLVTALEKVKQLPPERQKRAADLMMSLCEDLMGDEESGSNMRANLSPDEFAELKQILAPLLVEILADSPADSIVPMLQQFGMDRAGAEAIAGLIEHFNTYSPEIREAILEEILQAVKYEDYRFGIDWSEVPDAVLTAWPVILETLQTHPEDIDAILHELGVDAAIETWIQEHPWKFAGISILAALTSPWWMPLAEGAVSLGFLADALIRIVQGIELLANHIKVSFVTMFTLLKNVVNAICKWVRSTFNAGVRFANSNPYFKVDTAKLRSYALRINAVNNRLRSLDSGLRGLYWQVGMLDIWDILCANLLTGGSPTLSRVSAYLNNSADRFEAAENKAYGYIGG